MGERERELGARKEMGRGYSSDRSRAARRVASRRTRRVFSCVTATLPGGEPFGLRRYLQRVHETSTPSAPRAAEKWVASSAASPRVRASGAAGAPDTTTCDP